MTVSLKHTFQSAKTDSADATLVQPSNWNQEHQLTLATNKLLGRATAGTGAAEEISIGTALSVSGGTLAVTNVPVANGGTGASTLTGYVKGNGTSAFTAAASVPAGDVSGVLAVANGGTGLSAPGSSGNLLTSNGTAWISAAFAGSQILQVDRTSNTQLVSNNISNLINITSGTFSQTFAAASTLGNGWFCYIRNAGTGDITLDPDGSETIDGLTSYIMYPGEVRLVQCNGTSFTTIVLQAFYRVFTASGTFTKPPGYSTLNGILWGGGGSGAVGNFSDGSGGGGGGCGHSFSVISSFFSNSCTVTIGAGATGVTGNTGNTGGTSSFDGKIYAYGGGGAASTGGIGRIGGGGGGIFSAGDNTGTAGINNGGSPFVPIPSAASADNPGFGGGGTRANYPGGNSYAGGAAGGSSNFGGSSFYGGAGGGGMQGFSGGSVAGGTSVFGGAGGSATSASGTAGSAPGGGGGGSTAGTTGAGARGELRIWGGV